MVAELWRMLSKGITARGDAFKCCLRVLITTIIRKHPLDIHFPYL